MNQTGVPTFVFRLPKLVTPENLATHFFIGQIGHDAAAARPEDTNEFAEGV